MHTQTVSQANWERNHNNGKNVYPGAQAPP